MARQEQPFTDAILFAGILGGALLMLAGGVKVLLRKVRLRLFVSLYAILIGVLGALSLELVGLHSLVAGWILMAGCVGGLLLSLRRRWHWTIAGTTSCITSCIVLLGGCIIGFFFAGAQALSSVVPLLVVPLLSVAIVLTLLLLALHIRYRHGAAIQAMRYRRYGAAGD